MKHLLVAGMLAASSWIAAAADLNLMPWPATVQPLPGEFALNNKTVVTADALFTNEAALLADAIHLTYAPRARENLIRLTTDGADGLGDEAYKLEVNTKGATIHARTAAGAFYGCQTLQQLAEPNSKQIPFIKVTDSPRYAWRGLMLDVSRHFFDKPTVLRVLDWMADYKLNRFHLHLTDDPGWRVEIQKYPELTRTGACGNFSDTNAPPRFFTRADLREIAAYAACRHIVVVPEIDMPGHASAATRTFPQLDGGMHTYNPAREETYEFLENVLRDVAETFPSPWIHFGGDEVNHSKWELSDKLKSEGVENSAQMEGYFVRRMTKSITQQGRTPMGWDEIVAAKPATNTVVYWWRHDKPQMLEKALASGYSVVLTPRSPCYFDYPQDKSFKNATGWKLVNTPEAVYRGPLIPTNLPFALRKQILGVEACVWTERIATVPYLEFMLMPRLEALAEMAWTPDEQRDFNQFNTRLKPQLERFRQLGIHYYDPANPTDMKTMQTDFGFIQQTNPPSTK